MMNTNKILTVSYGTFSCTLEGFEDSFGTMKVIAEYFRDLAADDRYFGAEPPQPDADMLARIAQKEVSRKVEAREQDGKIVLSALDAAAAPVAAVAAASYAAIPDAVVEEDHPVEEAVTEEIADAPQELEVEDAITLDEVDSESETTSVIEAEDLTDTAEPVEAVSMEFTADEIEESVAEPEVSEVEGDVEEVATDDVEDSPVTEATVEFEDESAQDAAFVEDENDIVPGQPDAEVSAFFAASPTDAPDTIEPEDIEVEATDVDPMDAPVPDSIAAKLQRIRAVVSSNEDADAEDAYMEDLEDADAKSQVTAEDEEDELLADGIVADSEVIADAPEQTEAEELISDARADIEEALQADEAAELQAEDAPEESADEIDAILDDLDEAKSQDDVIQEDIAQDDKAGDEAVNALDEVSADAPVTETPLEDSVDDSVDNLFQVEEASEAPDEEAASAETPLRNPQVDATPEQPVTGFKNPRTRVIKVKRVDLEAAIEKGDLEEYTDTAEDTSVKAADDAAVEKPGLDDLAPAKSAKTALSTDQQNELARELAALEDDIAEVEAADPSVSEEDDEAAPISRRILPNLEEPNRSPVSRLLAETDHQMDEPESATRRDAFAHLRAAVAAKKADESMDGSASDRDDDDAYREDLAEAVRPRRPISRNPQTERPDEPRPAPLKLVAEQRISSEDAPDAGPVQPRRIAAETPAETAPDATDATGGFADFATEMGASTLPQLLEAAAAYMSFVEGREQFSRPQLMTKVRQAEGQEGFSREDGLRSFGQLLRAGKIEKLKGGRFTVSEDIGYRPNQRAVG